MTTTQINFQVVPDYVPGVPPLHLTVRLGDQVLLDQPITETVDIVHEVTDDEGQHCLEFEMLNKTYEHSPWDSEGRSLGDCLLRIENLTFDGIQLTHLFNEHARYSHSYNDPNGTVIEEECYGVMGCNGHVRFNFETPIYLWLLENM
jgi:hypothetical protein